MYDLSAKEVFSTLVMTKGDVKYTMKHFFRLPTKSEWATLLKSRNFVGYSKGKETFEFANVSQEEDQQFWESLIIRVEGYKVGGKDLMEQPNWKELLPIQHKLEAIAPFFVVNKERTDDTESVVGDGFDLDSTIGVDIKLMVLFNGKDEYVTFQFRTPDQSDYIRYNRMSSKMQMVRTKQKGVSAIKNPVDLGKVEELFDKLIFGVTGYEFDGKSVLEVGTWKSFIPLIHKRDALRELFSASEREEDSSVPLE
jgi:hypothetical protein